MEQFNLYYSVHDCGDGSAYPSFFATEEEAKKDQEGQEWGEPCIGSVRLIIDNGKICLLDNEWNTKKKKHFDIIKKLNFTVKPLELEKK